MGAEGPDVGHRWRNLAIPALLAVCGCGSPAEPAPLGVRGTVTFLGRPLVGGTVVFAPDADRGTAGKPAFGTIGPDGSYQLSEGGPLSPGWYRVAIADSPGRGGEYSYRPRFPAQLRRPDRSGLTRQVLPGGVNVLDFAIDVPE